MGLAGDEAARGAVGSVAELLDARARIRRRVASRMGPFPLMTRETVATETPASRATSLIVTTGAGRSLRAAGTPKRPRTSSPWALPRV